MHVSMTTPSRPSTATTARSTPTPSPGPDARAHAGTLRGEAHARFVAALARDRPARASSAFERPAKQTSATPTPTEDSPTRRGPTRRGPTERGPTERAHADRTRSEPPRKEARRAADARGDELDPTGLEAFRPLPRVLQPPPMPVAPAPVPRQDLGRLAEQLVTRMRVGRSREGASVELRLALGDRELDVRLVETVHGLELHTDGDDAMRDAIARELLARGLPLSA
jgi:hypothetical protein